MLAAAAIKRRFHSLRGCDKVGPKGTKTIKAVGGVYLGSFSTVKLYGGQKV
jgi:hypothetical protein